AEEGEDIVPPGKRRKCRKHCEADENKSDNQRDHENPLGIGAYANLGLENYFTTKELKSQDSLGWGGRWLSAACRALTRTESGSNTGWRQDFVLYPFLSGFSARCCNRT